MKIVNFILLLTLGLLAAPVLAQEFTVPGKGSSNGVGDQDYLIQREKILKRMKAANPQPNQQTPEQAGNARSESTHDSGYGQGYGSREDARNAAPSRPSIEGGRPERPGIERPERSHIERPGRP
jgi:hypothetical protein